MGTCGVSFSRIWPKPVAFHNCFWLSIIQGKRLQQSARLCEGRYISIKRISTFCLRVDQRQSFSYVVSSKVTSQQCWFKSSRLHMICTGPHLIRFVAFKLTCSGKERVRLVYIDVSVVVWCCELRLLLWYDKEISMLENTSPQICYWCRFICDVLCTAAFIFIFSRKSQHPLRRTS